MSNHSIPQDSGWGSHPIIADPPKASLRYQSKMESEPHPSDPAELQRSSVTDHSVHSTTNRPLMTGVPYVHPNVDFFDLEHLERLEGWDRLIVLVGGCIFGFSLGASSSLLLFGIIGESIHRGLLVGSTIGFVSIAICVAIHWRTQRLLAGLGEAIHRATGDPNAMDHRTD